MIYIIVTHPIRLSLLVNKFYEKTIKVSEYKVIKFYQYGKKMAMNINNDNEIIYTKESYNMQKNVYYFIPIPITACQVTDITLNYIKNIYTRKHMKDIHFLSSHMTHAYKYMSYLMAALEVPHIKRIYILPCIQESNVKFNPSYTINECLHNNTEITECNTFNGYKINWKFLNMAKDIACNNIDVISFLIDIN
jgi:hypothetical protein